MNTIPISANFGSKLQILVESQGRINFNIANDFKGILGDVKLDGNALNDWTITGFPLDSYDQIYNLLEEGQLENGIRGEKTNKEFLLEGPTIFHAKFDISANQDDIMDTYLNPNGWGKVGFSIFFSIWVVSKPCDCFFLFISQGIVFVNGFNLGRYWPMVGPQITLYLPKELLRHGQNDLTVIELQTAPENGQIGFSDVPYLDNDYNSYYRRRARYQ